MLELAATLEVTAQDATYLALARAQGSVVVTNDKEQFADRCDRAEVFTLERYVREKIRVRRR